MKQTDTGTLVQALRLLASDIHCCEEDVVTSVMREAADKIEELSEAVRVLHDLLHRSQATFVPSTDGASQANRQALMKYEFLTRSAG